MKTTTSIWGFVLAITLTGCQQNSTISPEAADSADVITDPVESSMADESFESDSTEVSGDTQASEQTAHVTDVATDDMLDDNESSEHGMGHGLGRRGMGMGRGPRAMGGMRPDMTTLHTMFASRDKIQRTVTNLPNGAEATTESDDAAIAALLQEHVPAMEGRVLENNPLPPMTFHPVFVELIKHAEDYSLEYKETEKGITVTYHADDPFVVMLVQEHAKLVSRFIKNGMEEIHTPYTLPKVSDRNEVPAQAATGETN